MYTLLPVVDKNTIYFNRFNRPNKAFRKTVKVKLKFVYNILILLRSVSDLISNPRS